jgi:glycosyltransferase involved in cell wall biosynthesis
MTLGIFTDDFYPHIGGIGRYVCEITKRLPQKNLLIFSPCDNKITNHIKIETPFHNTFRNVSFSLWLHQNVNDLVKKYNLSKINIQCGPGGLFPFKKVDVPVIATCHHTYWQQSHYIQSQFWKRIFIPFEKRTYQHADRIICDSEDSEHILIDNYDISPEKIVVIPIGIDGNRFHSISSVRKIPQSLLFVGRIDKRKGVEFLIKAVRLVVKEIPDVKLFIGGTGKDVPKLKKYVKRHNLAKNVEFLGFIFEDELNEWYNKVNCVVVPSVFEGFGLTAIEAMSCGTPVIATNVNGLKNIIENDVNGFLVEYNDIRSLHDRITYLLGDETKQAEFIKEGKRKVATVYNWNIILERVLEVYGQFS